MKKIELEAQNSKLLDVLTFINGNKRTAFFKIPSRFRPMIAIYLSSFIGADGEVQDGIVLTGL